MILKKILLALSLSAIVATQISPTAANADARGDNNGWDALWTEGAKPTKGTSEFPAELADFDFETSDSLTESEAEREPASVKRKGKHSSKSVPNKKVVKGGTKNSLPRVTLSKRPAPSKLAQEEMQTVNSASVSESSYKWPATASEGFEFKVRHKAQLSSMWVMKREGRYDLVFATNGGSRVNLTIPPEQFYALTNAATDLRAPASDTSKCKDSYVQINVIASGTKGKQVSTCLNAKGKDAEQFRMLGATLSTYVR